MSDESKTFCKIICILVIVVTIISNVSFIFPFMSDDEYFVDKYGNIHGDKCPYKEVPWFTQKHSKYDIIIKSDQEICRECLLYEEDKLMELHYINIEEEIKGLQLNGADDEYIENRLKQYYYE